jgi:rhamnulokinase
MMSQHCYIKVAINVSKADSAWGKLIGTAMSKRKNQRHYLALDLGAESGRAIVGTILNGSLSLEETHRFLNQPIAKPSGLHWDVSRLWCEIKKGIAASAVQFPLVSLALDSWGVDFALLGQGGKLLGDPYHYRDRRTDGMLEVAFTRLPREEIFAQTGTQFMQINTLYQLLSMVIAKDPQLEAASIFLTIPDLFNHWLSGQIICEFTNATTTQCFNPLSRSWAVPLLEALGIPSRIFPSICEPGTHLGGMLTAVANETGASSIPIIAPACHDTGSAVVAVPAEKENFSWLSSGTWSILGTEVRQPVLSEKSLAYNFTNEGGIFGTWRLSKNIMGLWLVQECKREWNLSYDELTRLAAEAKPFLAVVDPDNTLFLHPGNMPEKIRKVCAESGQPTPETQGEIIRVALESLALKYRFVLEQLEELAGQHLEPLHIIGGGVKNRLLNQFSAEATGRTVIAGPMEATAIGNILMQAIALGNIGSISDARLLVRRSFAIEEYHPGDGEDWDRAYAKLKSLLLS